LAVFAFLDVLVDCGTSSAAVQHGAGGPRAFAAALAAGRRLRARAALVAAGAVTLGALLGGEAQLPWVCFAALAPLARVLEMSAVVFQRELAWGRPLLLRALGSTLRLALIAALATRPGLGFGPFLLVHSAALALGNVVVHLAARASLPPSEPPAPDFFAQAWPLALLGLVQQAYQWADNAFLRVLAGPEELGRYNAGVRLYLWFAFFAAFATTSALPWLARLRAEGELGRGARQLATPLALGAAALVGALLPWRAEVLGLSFGPTFVEGAPSLAWLLLALLAVAPGSAWLTALIAAGRMRTALRVALFALSVNLAGNALLVPPIGALGAAATTCVTEVAVALGAFVGLHRIGASPCGMAKVLVWMVVVLSAAWTGSNALRAAVL
jgi:O-antigen/teichoic acid export membrane protein